MGAAATEAEPTQGKGLWVTDIGTQMLDTLYELLMIDDRWSVRREHGFTWWGYRLAQHFEVGPPFLSDDVEVCTVRIWTEVAENIDPATDPTGVLAALNPQATLNALVWDTSARTVAECCTAVVEEQDILWLSKVLATAAVLQNTAGHSRAHGIAKACGGVPAASNHPTSGQRTEMDDILNVPERLVIPAGAEPSKFAGPMMEELGPFLRRMRLHGSSDSSYMTCEVPFTGHRPHWDLRRSEGDTLETSLVRIFTDAPHPEAGNGALLVMQLPVSPGTERAATLANELNAVESKGDSCTTFLGAWCPDLLSKGGDGLAFCSFVPNFGARPGLLSHHITYLAKRSRFAAQRLTS
jgi:hypothetical protein